MSNHREIGRANAPKIILSLHTWIRGFLSDCSLVIRVNYVLLSHGDAHGGVPHVNCIPGILSDVVLIFVGGDLIISTHSGSVNLKNILNLT